MKYIKNDNDNLAFKHESDAKKILDYLLNDFKAKNIYEEFYKEAIIISANSGMRKSEIRDLEYGCAEYCEEYGIYKIVHKGIDKLNKKGRTIYITKDGYEAIKRAEKLKRENDVLVKVLTENRDTPYVHLFMYKDRDTLYSDKYDKFIIDLKAKLKIEDNNIKANFHAFRHFYAMTLFKESNYNISIVKYLLGHNSYTMTSKYLEQEKEKEILQIRERLSDAPNLKYSGKAIDEIVNKILKRDIQLTNIKKRILDLNIMDEIIHSQQVKKLPIGYCVAPCEKMYKCFKCNHFLIASDEKDKLLDYMKSIVEIISFKINLFNDIKMAQQDIMIKNDINDLKIIINELVALGIEKEEIFRVVKGEQNWNY